jgi:hypothetical protein
LLFGTLEQNQEVNPTQQLAYFPRLSTGNETCIQQAHESLVRYLLMWASQLTHDKGLTTPVIYTPFQEQIYESNSSCSMKLLFKPPKRIMSFQEQARNLEKGMLPDQKGAKLDSKSQGGVKVVIMMSTNERMGNN